MSGKIVKGRLVAAVLLSSALLAAVPSRAADIAPYRDRDSNYLKVAYYFVYPVGKLAELVIFRPLHLMSALSQPDPDLVDASQGEDVSHCLSFRPTRRCGRHE